MKLHRAIALLLVLCTVFVLCACGKKNTEEPTDSKVTYTVKVVDTEGNPVTGASLQLCSTSCMLAQTDEAGVAVFETVADDYKVSFVVLPAGYTADAAEYHFGEGEQKLTITLQKVS